MGGWEFAGMRDMSVAEEDSLLVSFTLTQLFLDHQSWLCPYALLGGTCLALRAGGHRKEGGREGGREKLEVEE